MVMPRTFRPASIPYNRDPHGSRVEKELSSGQMFSTNTPILEAFPDPRFCNFLLVIMRILQLGQDDEH
jgi:hypothetical protein